MTNEQVIADIQWLHGKLGQRDAKYLRNLNRFLSNGNRREGIRDIYTAPPAFYNAASDNHTGTVPAINVGRSMTMTLLSKLIQTKGRVFFNPVDGMWETIKVCRNAQIFFDQFYEVDKVYEKVQKCVQDGLIFDMGVMWINDEDKTVEHVHPWQFYIDPAEYDYGKVNRAMLMQEDYPLSALKGILKSGTKAKKMLEDNPIAKATIYRYWNIADGKKYIVIGSEIVSTSTIKHENIPFAIYHYNKPIKGLYSVSLIDNIYSHQKQIDGITKRIHDALTLSPANTIYVPTSAAGTESSMAKMMSNQIGNIVPYQAALGQVIVSTPPPIDPMYQQMLSFFTQSAFEQEGVSQLSAQSKKPSGINSGVALDTLQDVESERFQAQVDQLIQFYKDLNSAIIDVFPENDDILPKRIKRTDIKWKDIKTQASAYSMQSSLASVLSKDPKVKMEQIEKLQQQGIINPYMAASLLQLPDLEGAYSAATASFDYSKKIIERAIDNDVYEFYDYVNLKQLLDEEVNVLLQLDAADEKPEVLLRLNNLIQITIGKLQQVENIQNPPQEPLPVEQPTVKEVSMDSGQIEKLAGIVGQVAQGAMTPDAAGALIKLAFPTLPPEVVMQMLGVPQQPPQEIVE